MSVRYQVIGGVAFAAITTLGGVLASRAETPPNIRGAMFAYAPDSTPLFGAKQFNAPASGSTIYTERFLAVSGADYVLKVENGAPNGTGRVSTGTIRLNSAAILSPSDFSGSPALLTRFVTLASSDTLKVELSAGSGQFVTVSVLASPNPRYPIQGPTLAQVTQGSQVTVNDNFTLPSGASGPFRVHVVNGPGGTTRVSNATVTINGTDVLTQNDINANIAAVERAVTLQASNTVQIKVKQSSVGNRLSIRFTATDTVKPKITLTTPAQNAVTGNTSIAVSGSVDDKTVTAVTVNGTSAPLDASGAFSLNASLGNEGQNTLTITAIDANGNRTDSTRSVLRDTQAPSFDVWHPIPDLVTRFATEQARGPISDLTAITVTANGVPLALTNDGFFDDMVPLAIGENVFTFIATDALGHSAQMIRTVVRDTAAPALNVSAPANNATTASATITVSGTATDATALGVTVNDDPVSLDGSGAFSTESALIEGLNVISVVATDAAGNTSTVVRNVTRLAETLPPDPSTVAPPLDRTVATTMGAATEFLYTGSDPIQTGVSSGTIDPTRVSVLRGAVMKRDGSPLSGVEITVLDHTEFGRTLSRVDGKFDFAVNGGGPLTVSYKRSGYLPLQRYVKPSWQDFEVLDDVVMIPLDTAVTTIDFSTPMQVARASVMTDADGSRQATLMFSQGTQATMVMPDSSTLVLPTINVRATEYTVGENGPNAMPGPLPPTTGYTYAAELSIDEAIEAGATEVRFSQPVPMYVENFLQLPVGLAVPVAFYDRQRAAWVPTPNGRIIKIVSTSGGAATISVDTLGTVADSSTLAALGMSLAERQSLATLYSAGQSLWRMPIEHFSPMDGNFPSGPPPGSTESLSDQPNDDDLCSASRPGSIIECTTQVLGEELSVTGAPFVLSYRSNRVPGFRAAFRQRVRLTSSSLPSNLKRVELRIAVQGQEFEQSFAPSTDLMTSFEWDGRDAYGRTVQGRQPLTIQVGYVYPMLYNVVPEEAASFGLTCYGNGSLSWAAACAIPRGPGVIGLRARSETTLWRTYNMSIGTLDQSVDQQGAWTPSVHHVFDPVERVLYQGDGTRRSATATLTQLTGIDTAGFSGDGGPAVQAKVWDPMGVVVGPDRAVYFADVNNNRVRKIAPNGIITTIAGTGGTGRTGDGGLASQAEVGKPTEIAFGPDGSLYIAHGTPSTRFIRRIGPDGTISTIAGNGAGCSRPDGDTCGDNGPATQAPLAGLLGMAVGRDGTIYTSDIQNVIRRIGPDGIIRRIAGDSLGDYCHSQNPDPTCGDGGAARLAKIDYTGSIAVGPEGSVYLAVEGNRRVRRISPDGIISTVAGTGVAASSGDGGLATAANIIPLAIAVADDGSLIIADSFARIRRVGIDGVITTIAGTGVYCQTPFSVVCPANGAPPEQVRVKGVQRVAISPNGEILFSQEFDGGDIRRIAPFFKSFDGNGYTIASEDGAEVFEFDARGRHLRTRDALTKRIVFVFGYDGAGRLASITDADANVTTFERNGGGAVAAIVSPFGQRTGLTFDARGFLATVTNPAGEVVTVQHDSLGLLRTLLDARYNLQSFTYDSVGRLTRDEGPGGTLSTLARAETDTSISVTLSSALGRTEVFRRIVLPNGTVRRLETDRAGLTTQIDVRTNGTTTSTTPDGMVASTTETSDPRFGMQAPFSSQFSVQTPGGLQLSGSAFRKVTLANPADPMSLTSQTDSLVLNGRTFRNVFDAATRTLTRTSAEGRQSVTQLDTLGRVIEERVPGIAPMHYGYGQRGLLTTVTQAGRVMRYDYDSSGRVKKVTDPLGRFEQYAYDSVGRVRKQTLFNGSEVLYGYDANGNLSSLTPPGRPAHTFAYSTANLDSIYSPPAAGLPVSATKYFFNADRQLTRVLRPDSLAIDVGYDTAGRPRSLTLPNGQVQFAYSPTSGNLTTLTSADGGTLSYGYDGRLPTTSTWSGTIRGTVGFRYDSNWRVAGISVNEADSIAFVYDRDNLLLSAGAMTLVRDPQTGRVTKTALASDSASWTYDDSTGAVLQFNAKHGAVSLIHATYTRDSLDRITEVIETTASGVVSKSFAYDSVGRLKHVRANGVATADYAYDANGNRLSVATSSGTFVGTYDDQDRMLTYAGGSYAYGGNGELARIVRGSDTTRFDYDVLGNLTGAVLPGGTRIDYVTDAQGRRIGRRVDGVLQWGLLYQGLLAPAAELDGAGQVKTRFVYATRSNVPDYMVRDSRVYRIVSDYLGSVRFVVDTATGQVAQELDYDEFGRVVVNSNPGFQPFAFAGGIFDELTGLVHFGARDYDAYSGRWITKDPLLFGSSDLNAYRYALGNPVVNADPQGLFVWPTFWDVLDVGFFAASLRDYLRCPSRANAWSLAFDAAGLLPIIPSLGAVRRFDDYVDLTTAERRRHILDGDAFGGGHRAGTGRKGKSEFPSEWSDDRVMHEISDVATDPSSATQPGRGGRSVVRGTRGGVDIEVIVDSPSQGGGIRTGYPTNRPRNP